MTDAGLSSHRSHTSWAGTILIVTALLHLTFVTLVLGTGLLPNVQLREFVGDRAPLTMLRPGFGSQQPANLLLLTLFWSLAFGLALLIVGLLVRALERRGDVVPRSVGLLLLGLCSAGAVLVPASGFWFGIVPALMILRAYVQSRAKSGG